MFCESPWFGPLDTFAYPFSVYSNRLVNSCHAKCISDKYHEPDLNKGEGVCIDRCTAKFFEVSARFPFQVPALYSPSRLLFNPALRASYMPLFTRVMRLNCSSSLHISFREPKSDRVIYKRDGRSIFSERIHQLGMSSFGNYNPTEQVTNQLEGQSLALSS